MVYEPQAMQLRANLGALTHEAIDLPEFVPWADYSPTWSTTGVAPDIGNGSLNGRWMQIGTLVLVRIDLTFGTTTDGGTGQWRFSLPGDNAVADMTGSGYAVLGASKYRLTPVSSSTLIRALSGEPADWVDVATPGAWGSGDKLHLNTGFELAI